MGCGPSVYVRYKRLAPWKVQFEALRFNESEIERLYKLFRKVDVDESGSIELVELLVHIDLERTKFTERIFSIFDEDGSGQIDFREFVLSLWNYCTLSSATLALFAFDLYDHDSSGVLSVAEIEGMMREVYGRAAATSPYAKGVSNELRLIESNGDLDVDTFALFSRNHKAMLFPAFLVQSQLQKKILGLRFWNQHANRRIEITKGKFLPVAKFMEIHLRKDIFNQFVDTAEDHKSKVVQSTVLLVEKTGTHAYRKGNNEETQKPKEASRSKPVAKQSTKGGASAANASAVNVGSDDSFDDDGIIMDSLKASPSKEKATAASNYDNNRRRSTVDGSVSREEKKATPLGIDGIASIKGSLRPNSRGKGTKKRGWD
eukprot:gene22337-28925_t